MSRSIEPDRLIEQIAQTSTLASCYVISGDEILLATETGDALRAAAIRAGCTERSRFVMDARSDWSSVLAATQNTSLFGDLRLMELSLPTGKPGKTGSDTLQKLANMITQGHLPDMCIIMHLPYLDRATRQSKWAQALLQAATWVDVPTISRAALPAWIGKRLARQDQNMAPDILEWVADKVEGNLLAAFQEIQKLSLLYPAGSISLAQAQSAVLNVARYNLFDLRDAMLQGHADKALTVLDGLRAEGEALLLVLWAVGEEIRLLARLAELQGLGARLEDELRRQRMFGQRERLARQALSRIPANAWPAAVRHVQDIDSLIKGIPVAGRLANPWDELARLVMRIATAGQRT
ncbi:DNA polymerase III subunit delta [Alcaligenaceae bacterium CGII-47]|nr:DNA polymerase III subunit delta [Alcaligenaceae bacterium CGII-47]